MRPLPRAQDFAATLDSILGSRDDVEDITKPRPRPVPETRLRAPVIGAPEDPIARAAPELQIEVPQAPRSEPGTLERPKAVDRHLAISDAMRDWDGDLGQEPDNDGDEPHKKPDPLVGADVHTGDSDQERRLNIARRVGGIAQAIGGIIGIVNGARFGASGNGGLGGFAASQALMGAGGGIAQGAEHRIEEIHTDAQRRQQLEAASATQLQQDKQHARDDELNAFNAETQAANFEADNALAADRFAHQAELDDANLALKGQHESNYAHQIDVNDPRNRRHGGGGGGGGGHGVRPALPQDFSQPLPDPSQEAEAVRFTEHSVPAGAPIDPLLLAANRRRVATHYASLGGMKPNQQDTASGNYVEALGATPGRAGVGREILAARQQQRELLPLEDQGFVLRPGASIPSSTQRAEITEHWNVTRTLVGLIKSSTTLAAQLSPDQLRLIAQGRVAEAGPEAADLLSKLDQVSTLYRRYANFGTPQKAEFEVIQAMFPPPGANWSTLTGSNIARLRASGNTIANIGVQELNGLGFQRQGSQ